MSRKRKNNKSKSVKETKPKEEVGLLGELLSLICRAPFPFSVLGLVLKRLPSPWNNRALAIVLVAIGILIVYPLVLPMCDFSLWLYYRVIPGPSVLVNFNNTSGEIASVGKDFKFWISDKKNSDKTIPGRGAIPDGAIAVLPDTNKPVHIRLGRKREIHHLYRSDGYLRLCFKVDETDIEWEGDCSNVISKGLSLDIYNPNKWTSLPIALWFSKMGDDSDPNYLPFDTDEAIKIIKSSLDVFEVKACEPSESDPAFKGIVMNVIVGCFRAKGLKDMNELRIKVGGIKGNKLLETYETLPALPTDRIVRRIRQRIFEKYPLQGSIYKLQSEEDASAEQLELKSRQVFLDIGRLAGVREGDMFDVLLSDKKTIFYSIARVTIMVSDSMRSMALVSWDEKKIKEGYRVKWVEDK